VTDTGAGMSPEARARLFEPFFTTKAGQGTGLGLHSVAELVRVSGGELEVDSEPDQGASFTIRWPLSAPPGEREPELRTVSSGHHSGRVLLAEDEPFVRRMLARGLRAAGYDVVEASDGDDGARLLRSEGPFDVLCTDAVMPGRPTAELIRDFGDAHPGRPVLLMSGYLPEQLSAHVASRENVVVLRKPFSHGFVVRELERLYRREA